MARSVDEIKQEIKDKIRTYPEFDTFLFPEDGGSKSSLFNIIIFVVSASQFVFEAIVDALKADIQEIADSAPSGNAAWVRQQILNFQFGDAIDINTTDPDGNNYFVPFYPVIDESKQIITRCAVTDGSQGSINIKVAKGTVPSLTALSSTELDALRDYYYGTSDTEGIGFAGVVANFVSLEADRLRVEANIYYYGQFVQATVKSNVITAINNFLSTFADDNFAGTVKMIELVDAIQEVQGVSRVELVAIEGRAETTPFANRTSIPIQGIYQTSAGYVIGEDETGNTLNDTITMILETV